MEPPPPLPKRFVPNAELTVERDRIVIRDEEQRVAESFDLKRVAGNSPRSLHLGFLQ